MIDEGGSRGDGDLDGIRVVQQYGRNGRVFQLGTSLKKQPKTIAEAIRSRVLPEQPVDGRLASYRRARIGTRLQGRTYALDIVSIKGRQ
jgi:hypothetical protein